MPVKLPILSLERLVMFREDLQTVLLIEAYLRVNMEKLKDVAVSSSPSTLHPLSKDKVHSTKQSSDHL